jgi:hypothetical protein
MASALDCGLTSGQVERWFAARNISVVWTIDLGPANLSIHALEALGEHPVVGRLRERREPDARRPHRVRLHRELTAIIRNK